MSLFSKKRIKDVEINQGLKILTLNLVKKLVFDFSIKNIEDNNAVVMITREDMERVIDDFMSEYGPLKLNITPVPDYIRRKGTTIMGLHIAKSLRDEGVMQKLFLMINSDIADVIQKAVDSFEISEQEVERLLKEGDSLNE